MALKPIEQAIYNAVRQEGPGPVEFESILKFASSYRFKRDETLDAVWSLLSRGILSLTAERKVEIRNSS